MDSRWADEISIISTYYVFISIVHQAINVKEMCTSLVQNKYCTSTMQVVAWKWRLQAPDKTDHLEITHTGKVRHLFWTDEVIYMICLIWHTPFLAEYKNVYVIKMVYQLSKLTRIDERYIQTLLYSIRQWIYWDTL